MKQSWNDRLFRAREVMDTAQSIVIGGGAGLSNAAGLVYDGPRFTGNFSDFIDRYDMKDMYSATFYPFETEEGRWAYWARHIGINRYDPPAAELYKKLKQLVKGKLHFVLTTNVDHQFHKAGFPEEAVFAVQGDYGFLQCAKGCHETLYDNEQLISEMRAATTYCKIPFSLIPRCPVCGGRMDINIRKGNYFVEDVKWRQAAGRHTAFVQMAREKRMVLLELGVGFNTPGIIRYPFEQLAYACPDATIIRINRDFPEGARENKKRTIAFEEDMTEVIHELLSQ